VLTAEVAPGLVEPLDALRPAGSALLLETAPGVLDAALAALPLAITFVSIFAIAAGGGGSRPLFLAIASFSA
jgi:hypothetical protein